MLFPCASRHVGTHPNGGGKVLDEAEVSHAAYINENAEARDNSEMYGGKLIGHGPEEENKARLIDRARMFGGVVIASVIGRRTVVSPARNCEPHISRSVVACDSISGGAYVKHSLILDRSRVADLAEVRRVKLLKRVQVYGTAQVLGPKDGVLEISGYYRIHRGVWTRAPLYEEIDAPTARAVQECEDGRVHVGCHCLAIEEFLAVGESVARSWGWKSEHIEPVRSILERWRDEHGIRSKVPPVLSFLEAEE